jgi:hypothetical protein
MSSPASTRQCSCSTMNENIKPHDGLAPVRGIVNGVLLGAMLWCTIGLVVWIFFL